MVPTAEPETPPTELASLPEELHERILASMGATVLAVASTVSRSWCRLAPLVAQDRLSLPRAAAARGSEAWIYLLHTREELESLVGPRPARRWQDEWKAMRMEQARLLAVQRGRLPQFLLEMQAAEEAFAQAFVEGGQLTPGVEAQSNYAATIEWKRDRGGWQHDDAETCTLLLSICSGALARSLNASDGCYAASVHALLEAFSAGARLVGVQFGLVAPPVYANLRGDYGLLTEDASWAPLEREHHWQGHLLPNAFGDLPPCVRLTTRGFAMAMEATDLSFPDGRGYRVPVRTRGVVSYELQPPPIGIPDRFWRGHDVVRFVSAPADAHGRHSLVQTDAGLYHLPPLATVVLERVDLPGCWEAPPGRKQHGGRLLTCSVTFGVLLPREERFSRWGVG